MSEIIIDEDGTKIWYLYGKLHRVDGPAIEYENGDKYWYINGDLHREDGPAVEWANGYREWYLHGKLHREDGPAVDFTSGVDSCPKEWYQPKEWYLNGKKYSKEDWFEMLPEDSKMNALFNEHFIGNR